MFATDISQKNNRCLHTSPSSTSVLDLTYFQLIFKFQSGILLYEGMPGVEEQDP